MKSKLCPVNFLYYGIEKNRYVLNTKCLWTNLITMLDSFIENINTQFLCTILYLENCVPNLPETCSHRIIDGNWLHIHRHKLLHSEHFSNTNGAQKNTHIQLTRLLKHKVYARLYVYLVVYLSNYITITNRN